MESSLIGQPFRRVEDTRLLAGTGRYTDDIDLPGQLFAVFVRSPHAHADILSIDLVAAASGPGVVGAFTGCDLRDDGVGPIPTLIAERAGDIRNRDGSALGDPVWMSIAIDRVRHVGEPVAMVVAVTRD